jgi:hypothetical protein
MRSEEFGSGRILRLRSTQLAFIRIEYNKHQGKYPVSKWQRSLKILILEAGEAAQTEKPLTDSVQ